MRAIVPKKLTSMILLSTASSVSMTVPPGVESCFVDKNVHLAKQLQSLLHLSCKRRRLGEVKGEDLGGEMWWIGGLKERWINRYEVAGLLL